MRRGILAERLFLIVIMAMFAVGPCGRVVAAEPGQPDVPTSDRPWLVGYAEADITPAPGRSQMAGFGRERYARGAVAPLLTQVLVLRNRDGHTAVLITADVTGFDRVMVEAIRYAITKKHGVPAGGVMLAASHTHWGPAIRLVCHFACGVPNVWYLRRLEDTILAKVDEALKNLSPATIAYGDLVYDGIGCSRRLPKNGKIIWRPNPSGSFDGHTPIVRVRRGMSPRQLIIVGHGCHPTSSGQIEKWSPDYPGAMRDLLAARLPDTRGVFVQGCGGDAKVVHKDPKTGKLVFSADPRRSKAAGEKLAKAVLARLDTGKLTALTGPVTCALATGQLSYGERWSLADIRRQAYAGPKSSWQTWNARQFLAYPDHSTGFRYDVQVWRFGDQLTMVGMEGEVCSPWGPVVRSMPRTGRAMVVGYANSTTAYLPDTRMVREGGYEGLTSLRYYLPGPFTETIDAEVKAIIAKALNAVDGR